MMMSNKEIVYVRKNRGMGRELSWGFEKGNSWI